MRFRSFSLPASTKRPIAAICRVGYRAAVQGKNLQIQLGFSHDVVYPIPDGIAIAAPKPTSNTTPAEYKKMVQKAKEYIVAGDIFQVVLSQRFDLELDADPFDVYRVPLLDRPLLFEKVVAIEAEAERHRRQERQADQARRDAEAKFKAQHG